LFEFGASKPRRTSLFDFGAAPGPIPSKNGRKTCFLMDLTMSFDKENQLPNISVAPDSFRSKSRLNDTNYFFT
jgi:hypothetical protein